MIYSVEIIRKLVLVGFVLIVIFFSGKAQDRVLPMATPQLGSWGDQGDGTFRNPILNSNYPDSDVEQFGDRWYMISSKGTYMPGMTILESEDLVNWSIVGSIVDSISWEGTGDGVWAGDLVYHEGEWYCYFIDFGKGLFVSKSYNIKGPWSTPRLILEKSGMTDPTVYWDYEKREAYMICNYHIERRVSGDLYHIKLFKMNWEGTEIIDEGRLIYSEVGAEAPKIYHINDYYYLFISEWTVNEQGKKLDRRQIVLRSKELEGPFERKVLLEEDSVTGRSSSQGSLIKVSENEWWYTHQLVQNQYSYEGRPQFLIPVYWENDWPILGKDHDGNGINNTIWHHRKPVQGKPVKAPQTDDDFNSINLGMQWLWDRNPLNDKWSLSEKLGSLRLYSCTPRNLNRTYHSLPNKLLQRKMGLGIDTVTVQMGTENMVHGQKSGLIHIAHNFSTIGVESTNLGKLSFLETPNGVVYGEKLTGDEIWLRSIANANNVRFEYSFDGEVYHQLGKYFTMISRGFNGIFLGLYSMNNTGEGSADFRWFSYEYDGPKKEKLTIITKE